MCAIIDTDSAYELFLGASHQAGDRFRQWLSQKKGLLVIGGTKMKSELQKAGSGQRLWLEELRSSQVIREISDSSVDNLAEHLRDSRMCDSNDEHIIALARLSGARLLYSKDRLLHRDFTERSLISKPRGKVYSTAQGSEFRRSHRDVLQNRDLCKTQQ